MILLTLFLPSSLAFANIEPPPTEARAINCPYNDNRCNRLDQANDRISDDRIKKMRTAEIGSDTGSGRPLPPLDNTDSTTDK